MERPDFTATTGLRRPTRRAIRDKGVSVWLRAEFDVLMRRVRRRPTRPLLQTTDPEATLRGLIEARDPFYAQADLAVDSGDGAHEKVVQTIVEKLHRHLLGREPVSGGAPIRTVPVALGPRAYEIRVGPGLL